MRGILAAAGIAAVAATSVAPPADVALAAKVLTVTGYTFGGTIKWDMEDVFRGKFCSTRSGNTCSAVHYDSDSSEGGEQDGLRALSAAVAATAGPMTVLGFSQGATIATHWIRENADSAEAPSPRRMSFVLVANPHRKYGGIRPHFEIGESTPASEYKVLDIAVEYDGAADFPDNPLNLLAFANAIAGFQYVHIPGYDEIDLDAAEKLVWTEGNTTYVLIRRNNLPLLEPLRRLGLGELADQLNGPLKEIVDSAYDRDYRNLVDEKDHDKALQDALSVQGRSTALRLAGQSDGSGYDHGADTDVVAEVGSETDVDRDSDVTADGEADSHQIDAEAEAEADSASTDMDDDSGRDTATAATTDSVAEADPASATGKRRNDSVSVGGSPSDATADTGTQTDSGKPDADDNRQKTTDE